MDKPKYHPKAAFALFLNQAEHNIVKALNHITGKEIKEKGNGSIENIIKEMKTEEFYWLENNYFKFLRIDDNSAIFELETINIEKEEDKKNKRLEIKKNIFLYTYLRLKDLRNFYSHFYHKNFKTLKINEENQQINIFEIKEGTKEDEYLRKFLKIRFKEAKEFYSNFIHQTPNGFEHKYKPEHLEHLDLEDHKKETYKHYQFFNYNKDNKSYYFDNGEKKHKKRNYKSTVFLTSFFLDKQHINMFLDQVKGFKRSSDKEAQATREVFTRFCMTTDSSFKSENTYVRFFVDAFTHLSKVPRLALDNYKTEDLQIKISYDSLKKTKEVIFQQEKPDTKYEITDKKYLIALELQNIFDKLNVIENNEFNSVSELKNKIDELIKKEIEKIIGTKKYENYKDILINFALTNEQIRTSRDRFTEFALQFIDDFKLFDKIRFKIYSGRVFEILHHKTYHSKTIFERNYIRSEKIYSRINEIEKTQIKKEDLDLEPYYINTKSKEVKNVEIFDNAQEPKYFIRNNNIFFEVKMFDGSQQKASMSVNELRNLIFALDDEQQVENRIIGYLTKYRKLLTEILSGKNPSEIKVNIPEAELPKYIVKYLKSESSNIDNYKKDVLNKLEYLNNQNKKSILNLSKIRKYEKVREITRFFNNYIPKYIDQNQHQELEKLLGNYPKSKNNIANFIKEQNLNKGWKQNLLNINTMFSYKSNYNSLDDILNDIYNKNIEWCKQKTNKINKTNEIDKSYLDKVAKIINVTERNYSFDRIKQNIETFLNENIVIPRGFIRKYIYNNINLSEKINKKVENELACVYCNKVKDLYTEAQSATNSKREKYIQAKKLNEQIIKDKVLFLMAKKYLEKKITGTGKKSELKVTNEIGEILKEGIEIEKFDKKIKFGINEFDRIHTVLNDKRLKNILKNYLPHLEEIYYVDRKKYDEKNLVTEKLWDLQDVYKTIDEQQLKLLDAILQKEEDILFEYLSKQAEKVEILPRYVERHINRTTIDEVLNKEEFNKYINKYRDILNDLISDLLTEENRIKTEDIFAKASIPFDEKIEGHQYSIRHYRNAAFHNGLPESGTFEDGINLLDQHIN